MLTGNYIVKDATVLHIELLLIKLIHIYWFMWTVFITVNFDTPAHE